MPAPGGAGRPRAAQIGGSRATAAASDHHAARPVFQSASVLIAGYARQITGRLARRGAFGVSQTAGEAQISRLSRRGPRKPGAGRRRPGRFGRCRVLTGDSGHTSKHRATSRDHACSTTAAFWSGRRVPANHRCLGCRYRRTVRLIDVATLDRRHFTVVRPHHVDALNEPAALNRLTWTSTTWSG